MARGGKREGKPGVAHANRTDLNAPKAPVMRIPGQEYGVQAQQVQQQQAVPAPPPGVSAEWVPPPAPTPLHAPTTRPDEPVTQGLESGAGAGPEILGVGNDPLSKLRAIYDAHPSQELLDLIIDSSALRDL